MRLTSTRSAPASHATSTTHSPTILVEGTLWPMIVIGVLPDAERTPEWVAPVTDERLSSSDSLRLAVIVGGTGGRSQAAHDAVFEWLRRHHAILAPRTFRMAWVIEDETMRGCAEAWQALIGGQLFGAESSTFRTFGPAMRWLLADLPSLHA